MTTTSIEPGDLCLAEILFTSGEAAKVRPALVLCLDAEDCVVCLITSVGPRGERDVVLQDWSQAGLLRPSTCRIGRLTTIEKRLLIRRIGRISDRDGHTLAQAWYTHNRPGWDTIPW